MRTDMTGQVFGRLTVLEYSHSTHNGGHSYWKCQCECGNIITTVRARLKDGRTRSCGCLQRDLAKERYSKPNRRIGETRKKTPEYTCWQNIKTRCFNPSTNSFKNYGERGITICDEWRDNFDQFFEDMGTRPSPKHSVERKDNSLPYSKENCVWALPVTQVRNRRITRKFSMNGVELPIGEWCEKYNANYNVVYNRVAALGWDLEEALTTPVYGKNNSGPKGREYQIGLMTLTIAEWSKLYNIYAPLVRQRIKNGWNIEEALTTPSNRHKKKKSDTHTIVASCSKWAT